MPRRLEKVNPKILALQANLASIRFIANWTAEELGTKIGVTKQTISNIENSNGKANLMNATQYIALRAVIDNEIIKTDNPILRETMNYLFNNMKKEKELMKLRDFKDDKVTQLAKASKASYIAENKTKGQLSELEKRAYAILTVIPLIQSILGPINTIYKTFSFVEDISD
ncbi:helix-turn-helix transcriptional regulator [Streptococcus macacae]|uniref:DNA-binding helix-turn-helix domain protein n=1 Tax=Streptococcus macacae NCTC 11558 TaxID=764298 RepID=G5JU73_9STRE|nr:helix-turn-helix transcriptional regulator [Streptococcus macacae]EHJ52694.1 DNA-binding helix-turn-helix domain protein [Streptococcus macacae NCTC 11558]SUN78438.1 Uncharacterised protein [Streptococcus macacae NCTC 11558]